MEIFPSTEFSCFLFVCFFLIITLLFNEFLLDSHVYFCLCDWYYESSVNAFRRHLPLKPKFVSYFNKNCNKTFDNQ